MSRRNESSTHARGPVDEDVDEALAPSLLIPMFTLDLGWLTDGDRLVYAGLLALAQSDECIGIANDGSRLSCVYAMPARLARITGLTARAVTGSLLKLSLPPPGRRPLIVHFVEDRFTTFVDPTKDDALDVRGRWAREALYLHRRVAELPTSTLRPEGKLAFALIRRHECMRRGRCDAKQSTLARERLCSTRQFKRHVQTLKRLGLISVELRNGRCLPSVTRTTVVSSLAAEASVPTSGSKRPRVGSKRPQVAEANVPSEEKDRERERVEEREVIWPTASRSAPHAGEIESETQPTPFDLHRNPEDAATAEADSSAFEHGWPGAPLTDDDHAHVALIVARYATVESALEAVRHRVLSFRLARPDEPATLSAVLSFAAEENRRLRRDIDAAAE